MRQDQRSFNALWNDIGDCGEEEHIVNRSLP